MFWSNHETTLPRTNDITQTPKWPTFSPQTSKRIYADMELFRQCDADNLWAIISMCKQSVLFRQGDVVRTSGKYYLSLGHVQFTMVLCWSVESVKIGKTKHNVFALTGAECDNDRFTMVQTTDLSKSEMVPTTPVRPLHYLLACRKTTPDRLGVVLLQIGTPLSFLKHAAKHCFFELDRGQLVTLCKQERIDEHTEAPTLAALLTLMIKRFLKSPDGTPPAMKLLMKSWPQVRRHRGLD